MDVTRSEDGVFILNPVYKALIGSVVSLTGETAVLEHHTFCELLIN